MKVLLFTLGCIVGLSAALFVIKWQIANTVKKTAPMACSELTWMIDSPQERCI